MIKICRALDVNNGLITIKDAHRGNKYFCEVCGEEVIVKAENSEKKSKYFSHKPNTECIDNWSAHDMSQWHLSWQEKFPEECREVAVGNDEEKHRADVLVNGFVVEFQHSPISLNDFQKRNEFYAGCGYKIIWVFDGDALVKGDADVLGEYHFKRVQNQFFNYCNNAAIEIYVQRGDNLLYTSDITPTYFKSNAGTNVDDFILILKYWDKFGDIAIANAQFKQMSMDSNVSSQSNGTYFRPQSNYVDPKQARIKYMINNAPGNFKSYSYRGYSRSFNRGKKR